MKISLIKFTVSLAVAGALSACNHESPLPLEMDTLTPEEETKKSFAAIASEANISLYGDLLGYFENTGDMERSETKCKNRLCSVGYSLFGPSSISIQGMDLELLGRRRGINMFAGSRKSEFSESNTFGGWLEHSVFGSYRAHFINEADPDFGGKSVVHFVFGSSPGENPSMDDGSAEWVGIMFGRDISPSSSRGQAIRGDAKITVNFDSADTDAAVEFNNIFNIKSGAKFSGISWQGLEMTDGVFNQREGTGDYILGQFFGPSAQEVGGVFERNNVAGSFGAIREAR